MVDADPTDRKIRDRVLAPPNPDDFQKIMGLRDSLDIEDWLPKLERVLLKESSEGGEGKASARLEPGSLAVAFINKVVTVKELIDNIILGAEEILGSGEFPGIKKAMANFQ